MRSKPLCLPGTDGIPLAVSLDDCPASREAHEVVRSFARDARLEVLGAEQHIMAAIVHAAQGRWA